MSETQKSSIVSAVEGVKSFVDRIGEGSRRKQIDRGLQEVRAMVEGGSILTQFQKSEVKKH